MVQTIRKNHETYDGRGVQQTLNLRAFWKSAPGLTGVKYNSFPHYLVSGCSDDGSSLAL